MKLILTSIVAIIFIALGSFAGVMLKTPSSAAAAGAEKAESEGDYADKKDDKKKDDKGGDKKDAKKDDKYAKSGGSGSTEYYKFSREFVVPVMRNDQVKSLVILHINLEASSSTVEDLFSQALPVLGSSLVLVGVSCLGLRPLRVAFGSSLRFFF